MRHALFDANTQGKTIDLYIIHTGLKGILEFFSTNCAYLDSTTEEAGDRLDNKLTLYGFLFNFHVCYERSRYSNYNR